MLKTIKPSGRILFKPTEKIPCKCLNSVGEYVENSLTLAVSAPVNHSIKLGFVSVNDSRETYFVDALRTNRFRSFHLAYSALTNRDLWWVGTVLGCKQIA